MAEKFDAASRLAEGIPSVEDIANYVLACHAIGYQHPDLTLHAAQVRDWYASEDGMDLRALDADCAALQAVVAATEDALARQHDQLAVMSAAWQGRGADASREFLRRHGEASALAAAAIRTAANTLADLRDNLWQTVDGKVATVLAIDDRVQARRADWLAAAQTVTTGAGDRAVASELVDQEIKPFIDSAIRAEWVSAMRAAMAAVTAAYDAATAELTSEGTAVFDVPGDLGPTWLPSPRDDVERTPAAATSSPAPVGAAPSWGAPLSWTPPAAAVATPAPPSPPPTPSAPLAEPAAAAPAAATPPMPSLGGMGGGMPDIGSGFSGLGQQLAETLGGLFGSADDALADPPEVDDPQELDEPPEPDDDPDDDPSDEPLDDDPTEDVAEDEDDAAVEEVEKSVDPAVDAGDACAGEMDALSAEVPPPAEPPPPPEPAPTPAPLPPPPPEPAPPPSPATESETPCEIAADELPQVGQ